MVLDRVVMVAFFAVPVGVLSLGHILNGHLNTFIAAGVAMSGAMLPHRLLRLFVLYAALWLLWLMAAYVGSASDPFAVVRAAAEVERAKLACVWIMFAAVIVSAAYRTRYPLETILTAVRVTVIVQLVFAVSQMLGTDLLLSVMALIVPTEYGGISPVMPTGTLGNQDFFAGYIAMATVFFLKGRWRLVLPVIAWVLIRTHVTTAAFAVVAGVGAYYIPGLSWDRVAVVVMLALAAACFYVFFIDGRAFWTDSARFSAWRDVLTRVVSEPKALVFGFGPCARSRLLHPLHNDWLAVLLKYGLIGLSLLSAYAWQFYRGDRQLFGAFVAGCVHALGNHPMHLAPAAFLMCLVIGLGERQKRWQTT